MTEAIEAISTVTNMVDEMNDADTGDDQFLNLRCRESDAYTALDQILTPAMSKQSRVRLDEFLNASPELAHWLKRSQADRSAETPA